MDQTAYNMLQQKTEEAQFILVGLGEDFSLKSHEKQQLLAAYAGLKALIGDKTYFIVTQNEDDIIFESELLDFFIVAPFGDPKRMQSSQEQWNAYLNWLAGTLGHSLCILEFGVGFSNPQMIRWPFERTAEVNWKSSFVRINAKFPQLSENLAGRGISIERDPVDFLTRNQAEKCTEKYR